MLINFDIFWKSNGPPLDNIDFGDSRTRHSMHLNAIIRAPFILHSISHSLIRESEEGGGDGKKPTWTARPTTSPSLPTELSSRDDIKRSVGARKRKDAGTEGERAGGRTGTDRPEEVRGVPEGGTECDGDAIKSRPAPAYKERKEILSERCPAF
ncbi:hypothetical protein GWI33_022366 [Rhynchophorus ferrugineus]|uniref:Uncharacterized protein n=1 Tax=Rhynchophorus ferrugineus TaxID=354439 RepID=A0A834IN86_RHYFE|nr:hypothetical protein GWI33_022366 [Rhynchophorus ferrugineus]